MVSPFPRPTESAALKVRYENHLGPLGITGARARSVLALAEALATGAVTLSLHADPQDTMERLLELTGFGPWTAQYIAMRALGWPDAFLTGDLGVKKALAGIAPEKIATLSETWSPWRSYATVSLWSSLEIRPVILKKEIKNQ